MLVVFRSRIVHTVVRFLKLAERVSSQRSRVLDPAPNGVFLVTRRQIFGAVVEVYVLVATYARTRPLILVIKHASTFHLESVVKVPVIGGQPVGPL